MYDYMYQKTLANGVISWEYVVRRKGDCKSKIKLSPTNNFIEQTNKHIHPL